MSNENEKKEKLLQLVRDAVQQDNDLRVKFKIGDKFRFIRDRLNALLQRVEENLQTIKGESAPVINTVSEGEILVYVHLFNAQGLVLQTWQKMLKPSIFYEHSVNRPIYEDKSNIDSFLRSKTNKTQHAFLTVAIKNDAILRAESASLKDPIGGSLIKVKEGSLQFPRLISFTHAGVEYVVNEEGVMTKKDS